jgi:hypothetical protein
MIKCLRATRDASNIYEKLMFWEIRICQSRPSDLVRGPSVAIGNSGGARKTARGPSRLFIAHWNWV